MGVAEHLPERVRTPAVARAMFSPSATLLAGVGMSAAVLAGAPLLAAAMVGAAAWLGRVALAVPRKPKEMRVNPSAVREPWRSFVVDALDARKRFEVACARTREGPLKERLGDLGRRLDDAVQEAWRVARQGDALVGGLAFIDRDDVHAQLADLADRPKGAGRDRAIAALKSQLETAERIERIAADAHDRLQVLNAELDEAVARAVELSLTSGDTSSLLGVSNQVDSVVSEMESLRQALEETQGTPQTSAGGSA